MNKIRSLIIEDEPLAMDTLAGYVKAVPFLELKGSYFNAPEASEAIRSQEVDLVFLDINLPVISGLHFLETIPVKPLVIFTTAYPEYAVEGFEANAVDYLVKPFSFERFLKAVNRAAERMESRQEQKVKGRPGEPVGYIMLKADKRLHKINLEDIHFLESMGDYIKVYLGEKYLVVHETFRNMLADLPEELFIQVHKSFIIPLQRVNYIEGNQLRIGSQMIPIGAMYKEELLERLKGKG
jgi:DNA-binding LytR/AlgR family response regulator